jgi:two-component system, cell cycle response regulator
MHWVWRWDLILDRKEMVSTLFRETDRAQRMKMPLALIKVGIVACGPGRSAPEDTAFDAALREIVERIPPLLRCYDAVGQMAGREFLLVLPGCSISNARTLAERLRDEVFDKLAPGRATEIQFHACFGIASSGGRSPFVVLPEVDRALLSARADGASSIQCIAAKEETDPAAFFLPVLQDECSTGNVLAGLQTGLYDCLAKQGCEGAISRNS